MMDAEIKHIFDQAPKDAREKLFEIRALIFAVAKQYNIEKFKETIKWGQVSYTAKSGSTIRIGWQEKHPNTVSIFFNCKSSIVETIKEVYEGLFDYVGNRELVFDINETLPQSALKDIIAMGFEYHLIKHKPLLGR